ncbi:MAG: hypothetical protein KatS3mg117_3381 [Geminicoccaceae bacterium]|nr:MAG: hypothetical protein KatS3mg117_3381 [Geminicoccaceae bacterium]
MRRSVLALVLLFGTAVSAEAQHAGHGSAAPYAGQQTRTVTSFSEQDLAELRRAGGWGLAKPAELNGYPGPAHLLGLARELELTAEQEARIRAVFEALKRRAVAAAEAWIEAEVALDAAFRERRIDREELDRLLGRAEAARKALRFVHLEAHLEMPALLGPAQIARYEELRGYRTSRCAGGPPPGHDPAMWRRHTGPSLAPLSIVGVAGAEAFADAMGDLEEFRAVADVERPVGGQGAVDHLEDAAGPG